jgi:FtsH-binding integral membrane protein
MFDNKKRKEVRLNQYVDTEINARVYNLVMGICVLYGFVANALLVAFAGPLVENMNYTVFIIGYFICCIAGSIISAKSSNPVISFVGYNLICVPIGLLLSECLPGYSTAIIIRAAVATGLVTALMIVLSQIFPDFFGKLGKALFSSLLGMIIVEVILMFGGADVTWIDWVAVGIFSLYIGYDFHVAQRYPKTIDNAVDSAIDLYLDIINLFIRLLSIMSESSDD